MLPSRYQDAKKIASDIISTRHVERGSFLGVFAPTSGQSRLDFELSNPSGQFLVAPSLRLVGEILPETSGTFATDKPAVPNVGAILDRFQLKAGGQLVDEDLNLDSNILLQNLRGSGMLIAQGDDDTTPSVPLQPADYAQMPYSRVDVPASATTWSDFSIPLQGHTSQLFGPADPANPQETTVLLPLDKMPKTILSVYFKTDGGTCIDFVGASAAGGSVATYQLRNVRLEVQYVASPTLSRDLVQNGFSATFRSHQYTQFQIPSTAAGGKISLQIPSSFNSVSHVMGKIRSRTYGTPTSQNRQQYSSAGCSAIQTQNIRINGAPRYLEDLDAIGALSELKKIHPEALRSSYISSTSYGTTHQVLAWMVGRDYASNKHLAGYKTAAAVGSLVCELAMTDATGAADVADLWLTFSRHMSLVPGRSFTVEY